MPRCLPGVNRCTSARSESRVMKNRSSWQTRPPIAYSPFMQRHTKKAYFGSMPFRGVTQFPPLSSQVCRIDWLEPPSFNLVTPTAINTISISLCQIHRVTNQGNLYSNAIQNCMLALGKKLNRPIADCANLFTSPLVRLVS